MDGTRMIFIIADVLLVMYLFNKISKRRKERKANVKYLRAEDFAKTLVKGQIIDVRTKEEFKYSHIMGARNIPLSDIKNSKDKLHIDKPVFVYCQSGTRAKKATRKLLDMGFYEIICMNDNYDKYSGKKKEGEK